MIEQNCIFLNQENKDQVDPKKRLLFDPKESIDFQGNTGPFTQYAHARIKSVLSKANYSPPTGMADVMTLDGVERDLIVLLSRFPETITEDAVGYSPALIANYMYDLAKLYNKFYHESPIMQAETANRKQFRLQLSAATAKVISKGMGLLGIAVPERM